MKKTFIVLAILALGCYPSGLLAQKHYSFDLLFKKIECLYQTHYSYSQNSSHKKIIRNNVFIYDKDLGVLNGIRLDIDPSPPIFSWDTFSRDGSRRSIAMSVDQDCEYEKGFTKRITDTAFTEKQVFSEKYFTITELDSSGGCAYRLNSLISVVTYEPLDKNWSTKADRRDVYTCQWDYVYSILQYEIERIMGYPCTEK